MPAFRTTQLTVAAFAAYMGFPPDRVEELSQGQAVFIWSEEASAEASNLSSLFLEGNASTMQKQGGIDRVFNAYFDVRAMMFRALKRTGVKPRSPRESKS